MNIFKFEKKYKKKEHILNPRILWIMSLMVSFLIIIFSIMYGVIMLIDINKDFNPEGLQLMNETEKNREIRLEKAIEYFSNKKETTIRIINSNSPVVDPSN